MMLLLLVLLSAAGKTNYTNLMASIFNHTEQVLLHLLFFFAFHHDKRKRATQ